MREPRVVLDTNVFIAAGFKPYSRSAELVRSVREGRLRMVWNRATRAEIERMVRKIPPLSRTDLGELFRELDHGPDETYPENFDFVRDPDDRKFAALAEATGATLVTTDHHLLEVAHLLRVPVRRPGEV